MMIEVIAPTPPYLFSTVTPVPLFQCCGNKLLFYLVFPSKLAYLDILVYFLLHVYFLLCMKQKGHSLEDYNFKVFKCALCGPLPPSDPENLKGVIIIMPSVDRKCLGIAHLNVLLRRRCSVTGVHFIKGHAKIERSATWKLITFSNVENVHLKILQTSEKHRK